MPAGQSRQEKRDAARAPERNKAKGTAPSTSQTTASASGSSNAGQSDTLTVAGRISAMAHLASLLEKLDAAGTALREYYCNGGALANHRDKPDLDRQAAELKRRLDLIEKNLRDRLSALANNTACTEKDVNKSTRAVVAIIEPAKGFTAKFTEALLETQALQASQNAGST